MDMHEIEKEISILEQSDTTYQNCSKLAVLYSIRDHQSKKKMAEYSHASSEFLSVAYQAPIDDVMRIIDEHMDAIQLLHPKEYSAIINKIKAI